MRRYLAMLRRFTMFLVRAALRFLIVVLSSTMTMLSGLYFRKALAMPAPRGVENASTFIAKIFKVLGMSSRIKSFNSSSYFAVLTGRQRITCR